MLIGFARNLFSMNAMTYFEKYRMQATFYGDTSPPEEAPLKGILSALAGKDPEMKASLAFDILTAKLQTSKSLIYWNYVVKNLIILDRATEERLFLDEIAKLDLPNIETYKPEQEKHVKRRLGDFIRLYFNFIKEKAMLLKKSRWAKYIPKEKRKEYFQSENPQEILEENKGLSSLCKLGMQIFETGTDGLLKYPLTQYVFLLILHTMLNMLSVQYAAFIGLIEKFFETRLEVAKACFEAFKDFLKSTNDLILITGNYQFIPGFQISLYELRNPQADTKLLKAMQEYIRLQQKRDRHNPVNFSIDYFNVRREEFQVKRGSIAETDLPLCIEQLRSSIMSSPTHKQKLNIKRQESNDTPDEATVPNMMPNRPSQLFLRSFNQGFQGPVRIDDNDFDNLQDEELVDIDELIIEDSIAPSKEALEEETPNNLTSKFVQSLNINKKDDVFENHKNFYSEDFVKDVTVDKYVDEYGNKESKLIFEWEPLDVVNVNIEVTGVPTEVFETIEFDQEIFNNFTNGYSKE